MKRFIFATIFAFFITFIPTSVNATTDCVIRVESGETKTINYNTAGCRVENHGTLNIATGANISKYTQDSYAAIDNYNLLNISDGYIYADYGYAIFNKVGGTINVSGGTIHSILHQAIWANAGTTTNITGGTLKGVIGGEEVIYSKGILKICSGNFSNSKRSNQGNEAETKSCPKTEPPTEVNKPTQTTPVQTTTPAKAQTASIKTQTTQTVVVAETTVQPATETIKEEQKDSTPTIVEEEPEEETTLPEAGTTQHNDEMLAFVIALAAAVVGGTAASYAITRIRH